MKHLVGPIRSYLAPSEFPALANYKWSDLKLCASFHLLE